MPAKQARKKGKRPDARPARARYWSKRTLEKRKVRRLMRCNGFATEGEAKDHWREVRQGRCAFAF